MTISTLNTQLSPPVEVRRSGVHGRGVYATQFIPEGTRIIEYTGQRVSWENAPNDENNPHTFNFGLESGDRIFIYAMRDIEPGEELFYDYAMEVDEPITKKLENEFKCHCGAARCRGTMLELKSKRNARPRAPRI
jgi:uncharacterized protein